MATKKEQRIARLSPEFRKHTWTSTQARRDEFLRVLATGLTVTQAREAMDPVLSPNTLASWMKRYPEFRAKVHQFKGIDEREARQSPDAVELSPTSTFAERRWAYFGFETHWHHQEMIDAIESAPAGGVTLILLPPEHGKSTVLQDWISCRIGQNPNVRVIYLTGGLALAKKAIGRQENRLDQNGAKRHPRFHLDYGPFVEPGRDGKPWAADHFTVLKATHDEQDYTMEARSWTAKIAGTRVDDLVIDDIQELSSLNQTEEMLDRFSQDFQSRVRRLGRTIVIGTRVGDKDFYNALINAGLVDKIVMLPATDGTLVEQCELDFLAEWWPTLSAQRKSTLRKAAEMLMDRDVLDAEAAIARDILHELTYDAWIAAPLPARQALLQLRPNEPIHGCDLLDDMGTFGDKDAQFPHERPLCPQMWPSHALARKRKTVREDAWWRNFQQKPINAKNRVFTKEMIERARNRLLTVGETIPRPSPRWRRFAGLDPSLTGGNSIVVCESEGWRVRVLSVQRDFKLTRTEAIIDIIDQTWLRWRFSDLTIEQNAFQKGLVNDQRLANLARVRGFRIRPHTTGINKADPQFGVGSMAQVFENDAVEWAWGDRMSEETFGVLENELLAWDGDLPTRKVRQDTVMALWFCWLWWQKRRRSWMDEDANQTDNRWAGARRLPWTPQGYDAVRQLAAAMKE